MTNSSGSDTGEESQEEFMKETRRRTSILAITGFLTAGSLFSYSTLGSLFASNRPGTESQEYEEIERDSFVEVYEQLEEDVQNNLMKKNRFERRTDGNLGTGEINHLNIRYRPQEDRDSYLETSISYPDDNQEPIDRRVRDDSMKDLLDGLVELYGEEEFQEEYGV